MENTSLTKAIPTVEDLTPIEQARRAWKMSEPKSSGEESIAIPFGLGPPRAWQHTQHQFGYIAPLASPTSDPQPIRYPGSIEADGSLRNKQINIHLSRLRVYDYPGWGAHQILVTFKVQNQVANPPETVSFSQSYTAQQGQDAGVVGYPIFLGLNVGAIGASFEVATVNVKNDADQEILDLLGSPIFQSGLNLLTTVQPAIRPLTEMAVGITKMLAGRDNNIGVQKFYLGLDFGNTALGVRLAQGDYLAAQVPSPTAINWDLWVYDPNTGAIVRKDDRSTPLPYNYLVFGVSRYDS